MVCAGGLTVSLTVPGVKLSRHRHQTPYAALVLSGGYIEAGDVGRFRVGPGDVLFHDRFEAHQDAFGAGTTALINLPLEQTPKFACGYLANPDAIARRAEGDLATASQLLMTEVRASTEQEQDWPDTLAADILADRVVCFSQWADHNALRPASLSRGFRLAYGVTPKRFRLEARARRAARLLSGSLDSFAQIAFDVGFADQQHMTRAVKAVTGLTPRAVRSRHAKSVQ